MPIPPWEPPPIDPDQGNVFFPATPYTLMAVDMGLLNEILRNWTACRACKLRFAVPGVYTIREVWHIVACVCVRL